MIFFFCLSFFRRTTCCGCQTNTFCFMLIRKSAAEEAKLVDWKSEMQMHFKPLGASMHHLWNLLLRVKMYHIHQGAAALQEVRVQPESCFGMFRFPFPCCVLRFLHVFFFFIILLVPKLYVLRMGWHFSSYLRWANIFGNIVYYGKSEFLNAS